MKLNPRTHIGYLVGYDATNIFRIWIPHLKRVIRSRDVVFDEDTGYDPSNPYQPYELRQQMNEVIDLMDIPEPQGSRIFDDILDEKETQVSRAISRRPPR